MLYQAPLRYMFTTIYSSYPTHGHSMPKNVVCFVIDIVMKHAFLIDLYSNSSIPYLLPKE